MPPTQPPPQWINKDPRDRIDATRCKINLLCVPQAGMGAWAFHGWQKKFPDTVDVLPVELPGRNSRMMEPKPSSMAELIKGLADGVKAYGALSKPYVLFGHSLGGWVAYELAAELLKRGEPAPQLFVVSGVRAPHLSALEHDADKIAPSIAHMPDAEFWTHLSAAPPPAAPPAQPRARCVGASARRSRASRGARLAVRRAVATSGACCADRPLAPARPRSNTLPRCR
jgi:thioesterase domain-containing protein